jgi:DNA-binding NarL/FixJ family response regulator
VCPSKEEVVRIVLVDDEVDIRLLVRTVLADTDHEVVGEARDIQQAVAQVRRLQPDLIVTDLVMGAKEGAEPLLSELRAAAPLARVIIFSGWAQPRHDLVDGYVVKGGLIDDLVDTIDEIAGRPLP